MTSISPSIKTTGAARVAAKVAVIKLEVPFHDVDKLGIVWHGHYLKYFEQARTKLLRDLGLGGEIGAKFPYSWVVIESKIRHTAPLRFQDQVEVTARLVDVDYRIHVGYEVINTTTEQKAAKGHTMLATLAESGEMMLETPAELLPYLTEVLP